MAINAQKFAGEFISALGSSGLSGTSIPLIGNAIGSGFAEYLSLGVTASTVDTGTLGVGTGQGLPGCAVLTLASVASISPQQNLAFGVLGTANSSLASSLALAISNCMNYVEIKSFHPTVGVGYATGSLVPSSAITYMSGSFNSVSLTGTSLQNLLSAICTTIDLCLPLTIVNIPIVGSVSNIPAQGFGGGALL